MSDLHVADARGAEVLLQEHVQQHTAIQIVHVPVPQIQEQSAVSDLVASVEASQVVDSCPRLGRFCRAHVQPSPS